MCILPRWTSLINSPMVNLKNCSGFILVEDLPEAVMGCYKHLTKWQFKVGRGSQRSCAIIGIVSTQPFLCSSEWSSGPTGIQVLPIYFRCIRVCLTSKSQRMKQDWIPSQQDHGTEEAEQDAGWKCKEAGKEPWLWSLTKSLHSTLRWWQLILIVNFTGSRLFLETSFLSMIGSLYTRFVPEMSVRFSRLDYLRWRD